MSFSEWGCFLGVSLNSSLSLFDTGFLISSRFSGEFCGWLESLSPLAASSAFPFLFSPVDYSDGDILFSCFLLKTTNYSSFCCSGELEESSLLSQWLITSFSRVLPFLRLTLFSCECRRELGGCCLLADYERRGLIFGCWKNELLASASVISQRISEQASFFYAISAFDWRGRIWKNLSCCESSQLMLLNRALVVYKWVLIF